MGGECEVFGFKTDETGNFVCRLRALTRRMEGGEESPGGGTRPSTRVWKLTTGNFGKQNTGKTAGTLYFPKPESCRWLARRFPSLIPPGLV